MKNLILISFLVLVAGFANGQSLQKGNLVGTHVVTITLNQGVTLDKYIEFLNTRYIPEVEKVYPNWKVYTLKGVRGENPNSIGMLIIAKSQKDRDIYYNTDGTMSELGKKANERMKPVKDELNKLGTWSSKYTDWVVI